MNPQHAPRRPSDSFLWALAVTILGACAGKFLPVWGPIVLTLLFVICAAELFRRPMSEPGTAEQMEDATTRLRLIVGFVLFAGAMWIVYVFVHLVPS